MNSSQNLKRDLARTIRRLYERGLVSGVGGNASVISPAERDILITPTGFFKGGVAEGDIVRVTLDGKVLGSGTPSSELAAHLAAYRIRNDVKAVVHAHPPTAVGLITAGIPIPVMTPEHSALIGRVEVVEFALPGEKGARAVRESLKRCNLVGIRNHGFFSVGPDLHTAASRLEVIEESSKIYETARGFGKVTTLGKKDISKIVEQYARESALGIRA